jgi:ribonuclease P protein component
MRRSLTKSERLRRRGEIKALFADGKSVSGGAVKLVIRPNGGESNRFFVTLRKKFGTAVERNRARRLVKEVYRLQKQSLKSGYDIGCVVYQKGLKYDEIEKCLVSLFQRANLYENA